MNFSKAVVFLLCLSGSFIVAAQEAESVGNGPSSAGITSYPADFFADQGPVTAFDMIRYLPGFSFQDSGDSRGFSAAAGNVLINGRRPSAKSTKLQDLLQRVPAKSVERVEIIRGGAPGIDMQGLPIIANVVRAEGASSSNAIDLVTKFFPEGDAGGHLRYERSQQSEGLLFEGTLEVDKDRNQRDSGDGPVSLVNAEGDLIEGGHYSADFKHSRFTAAGSVARDLDSAVFRGNASVNLNRVDELETSNLQDGLGNPFSENTREERARNSVEVGGDYTRDLANGSSVEILGVQTLDWKDEDSRQTDPTRLSVSNEKNRAGESILRGSWRKSLSSSTKLELGAEGAFNFLDAQSSLTRNGTPISLPSANVLVEEERTEIFSDLTVQAIPSLSLGFGLRAEKSQITVTGGASAENEFSFIKSRATASYTLAEGTQLSARIEREVGQLDFEDFAAGSEFSSNTVNAGNPDLAPEHSWVYEVGVEQSILSDGAISLTYRHYEIEDVVDVIPVEDITAPGNYFAAPGNIGDGTREEIVASLTFPLSYGDADWGTFQLDATWKDSEVIDPVTGEIRPISKERKYDGEFIYTKELPSLNSTFVVRTILPWKETQYRVDQIITEENSGYWRVYWEWRVNEGFLFRTQIMNAASRELKRTREIYDGLRSDEIVEAREDRSTVYDPYLLFRFRWTF